jgi:hypothetical protein
MVAVAVVVMHKGLVAQTGMLLAVAVKETLAVLALLAVLMEMLAVMVMAVRHLQAVVAVVHLPQEQIQL